MFGVGHAGQELDVPSPAVAQGRGGRGPLDRRARGAHHPPEQALLLEADAALQARRRRATTCRSRPARLAGIRGRPLVLKRFVERRGGRGLLPEARARQATAVAPHGDALVPVRPHGRGDRRGRRRRARLDREPRVHRAPPAPGAVERSRPSRRAAGRPRSRARACAWADVLRVALRSAERPRGDGPPWVAEDERLARDARDRADRAPLDVHGGAARGARVVARSRTARAGPRYVEVVEGRAPRGVPRLQPEREGPHDVLRLLGAPCPGRARIDAVDLGRGRFLRARRLHRAHRPDALCRIG